LNASFDSAILQIDEAAIVAASPRSSMSIQGGSETGLACGVLEIGERAGILGVFRHGRSDCK